MPRIKRLKPEAIWFHEDGSGRKVHIYRGGEVFYKDKFSTIGRVQFKSMSDAMQYLSEMGYRP